MQTARAAWSCCAVVCVLAMAMSVAAAYTPTNNPASGQISPAILIMGEFDWKLYTGADGKPWSRCLDMVWRARKYSNGNRLNFVPTHHWLPNDNGLGVASYCYMHSSGEPGDKGTCQAWDTEKLAEFKKSMTYCFTEAFKQGFVPYVRPHLDDGLNRGIWRNSLLFSPTTKYGTYSYADVMVKPLAEAMRDALAATAKIGKLYTPPEAERPVVYMALQGEMSATLMRYTSDWASLIPVVRDTIGSGYADVKVGAGLNFNALDAVEGATTSTAGGFFGSLLGGAATSNPNAPAIQAANVNNLLSSQLDFLGISAYSPYSGANFGTSEFQNAAFNVGDALASLANGLNLPSLARSGKLELHYSEFGIGGGVDGKTQFAASADACAKQPWAGVSGSYSTNMDPWRQGYLSAFRSTFYSKAMDWLGNPGSGTYDVKEVFVWCMASWDLFGIYPDSNGADGGSFRDLTVVRKIAAYNTAVIAAQVCKYESAAACSAFIKAQSVCLNDASGTACLDRSSGTADPNVVTESGSAQPSTPAPSTGAPAGQVDPVTSSPAPNASTGGDKDPAAPVVGVVVMAPDASAAAPAPGAATASPAAAAASTKSSAAAKHLLWVLSVLLPVLLSGLLL